MQRSPQTILAPVLLGALVSAAPQDQARQGPYPCAETSTPSGCGGSVVVEPYRLPSIAQAMGELELAQLDRKRGLAQLIPEQ